MWRHQKIIRRLLVREITLEVRNICPLTPTFRKVASLYEAAFPGSLSTVVGDEKLTSREDRIGPLFMHVQSDEDTLFKVDKVSKTEAQTFDVFDQLISRFQFCI